MNAAIEFAIVEAVEMSMKHDCVGKVVAEIESGWDIFDVLGGVDYDDMAEENDGSYDVWGGMDENGEGDRSWRINIKLVKA